MTGTAHRSGARFSVVVPAYQAEATLDETLSAVLGQTYSDWECIVVDDGSSDDSFAIATRFQERDPRFRVIQQENGGTSDAYNTGVRAANGELIVICSADDVLLADHLATVAQVVEAHPEFDIYSTNGYFWRPPDYRRECYRPGANKPRTSLALSDVIRECFYSVGATYRRRWWTAVGGYRAGVYGEDYDFWLRAMALGAKHRYIPTPLSLHRITSDQRSADLRRVYRSSVEVIEYLASTANLTPDERLACEETVRSLRKSIERTEHPVGLRLFSRRLVRGILHRLLGPRRAGIVADLVRDCGTRVLRRS